MPRLVVPTTVGRGQFASRSIADLPPDDYKDRLIKYIPAEAVALFAFVDKALIGYYGINDAGVPISRPADALLTWLPVVFLLLGLIGTPVYLYRQKLPDQPWKVHAIISTVAFLFWAYTLGGSVFLINAWYNDLLAAIVAPVFTFLAGMFEPRPD
jgi:hypothetical protein